MTLWKIPFWSEASDTAHTPITGRTALPLLQHCVEVALSQTWRKNKTALEINKRLQTGPAHMNLTGRPSAALQRTQYSTSGPGPRLFMHMDTCTEVWLSIPRGDIWSVWVRLLRAPTLSSDESAFSRWPKFFNLVRGQKGLRVPAPRVHISEDNWLFSVNRCLGAGVKPDTPTGVSVCARPEDRSDSWRRGGKGRETKIL